MLDKESSDPDAEVFALPSLLLSSLELSDRKVYEPYTRARLGTAAHFCEVVVLVALPLPSEEGTT